MTATGARLGEAELNEVVAVSRQLDKLAKIADESLPLTERIAARIDGTRIHKIFQNLIKQNGNSSITTEESFIGGRAADYYGQAGSVRLDAVLRNAEGKIIAVFDLKTGYGGLTPGRIEQIRQQLGKLAIDYVPVFEIRP